MSFVLMTGHRCEKRTTKIILEVKGLKKRFPVSRGIFGAVRAYISAVDDVSFTINEGETLGLVGESGSGKTTVGKIVAGLIEPDAGSVYVEGEEMPKIGNKKWKEMRKNVQMVFQDPYSYLNPRHTVKQIVSEPLIVNRVTSKTAELRKRVESLLEAVGLQKESMHKYPHQFSGGQRQRIAIARSLALNPKFLVLDEVTSALDVSVQAQVLNLLKDLQSRLGLSYLFISHDLAVVEYLATKVIVMYAGKLVESADVDDIFANKLHPYTRALVSAVPRLDDEKDRDMIVLGGDIPNPIALPLGCRFHPRCPYAMDICKKLDPPLLKVSGEHSVACYLYEQKKEHSSDIEV